jgi:hypothetical protein
MAAAPVALPRPSSPPRRRWLVASLVAVLLVASLAGGGLYVATEMIRREVRSRALPALAARLDRPVTAGAIDVGLGAVTIHDLAIGDLAVIDQVVVRFTVTDLLAGRARIDAIDAHGVETWINPAVIDELEGRLGSPTNTNEKTQTGPERVDLSGAELTAHDVVVHATDPARRIAATVSIGSISPTDGGVAVRDASFSVTGESRIARLLATNPSSAITGTIARDGRALQIDLAGALGEGDLETWSVRGALGDGAVEARIGGEGVAVSRLLAALDALELRRPPLVVDDSEARIGGDLTVTYGAKEIAARGTVELDGVAVEDRRLAREPVILTGSVEIDAVAARDRSSVRIDRAVWRAAAAPDVGVVLSASLRRSPRRLSARLALPAARCAGVLAAIPRQLVPQLQGVELAGELDASVELSIDWSDLGATVLDGSIGIDRCLVVSAPPAVSVDRLRGSFEHTVDAGGIERTFVVGPESDDFVPVDHVSRNLIRSLLTTEDGSFFRHRGFRLDAFRTALIRNLERGRFAYGGSSITMQMVKNVMLGREKTVSRKLQELFLTWYVERELPKKRILEIYLNAIEFGPGLYGIKPAARQYFGKHPRRLNPVESAFFSSILPAPRRRFRQYCRGYVGGWTRNKMDRIIDRMFDQSRLDPDQYLTAIETPLIFRGKRRELCKYLVPRPASDNP